MIVSAECTFVSIEATQSILPDFSAKTVVTWQNGQLTLTNVKAFDSGSRPSPKNPRWTGRARRPTVLAVAEDLLWDGRSILAGTKSRLSLSNAVLCNVCDQGVQVDFRNFDESRSFTSAFKRLELETDVNFPNDPNYQRKAIDAETVVDDFDNGEGLTGFRTREMSTFRLVIQSPEILNYQGTRQAPEDIARYWKKDSRMWLWKSVRLARRRNKG